MEFTAIDPGNPPKNGVYLDWPSYKALLVNENARRSRYEARIAQAEIEKRFADEEAARWKSKATSWWAQYGVMVGVLIGFAGGTAVGAAIIYGLQPK